MSESAATLGLHVVSTVEGRLLRSYGFASSLLGYGVRAVRFVAFWLAVVLPCSYLSLLQNGLTRGESVSLTATLLFHLCVLVLGHGYRQPADGGP